MYINKEKKRNNHVKNRKNHDIQSKQNHEDLSSYSTLYIRSQTVLTKNNGVCIRKNKQANWRIKKNPRQLTRKAVIIKAYYYAGLAFLQCMYTIRTKHLTSVSRNRIPKSITNRNKSSDC